MFQLLVRAAVRARIRSAWCAPLIWPGHGNFSTKLAILQTEVLCSYPLDMAEKRDRQPPHARVVRKEVMPHLDSIYSMALRLARNRGGRQRPVAGHGVARLSLFFHQFTPGTNSRAWVLTILFNNFRNGYRKSGREQVSQSETEFTERLEAESLAADQTRTDPEALAFANVMAPEVTAALDSIPEEFRAALLLVDVQELSYQEVCESCRCRSAP